MVGRQEGNMACKKHGGGRWRWALVSLDGVAPSRMVGVSASVNLPLHHKVQKLSSGTGSRGRSRMVGWGLTALLTQNRSYRACRFVGIFYSKL